MSLRLLAAVMVAGLLAISIPKLAAQVVRPAKTAATLSAGQALPLTCEQAWIASGKAYAPMIEIVKTLARLSLANRNLAFPNTRDAGIDAGRGIADDCKADPHALLFAIVDKHFRRVAESARR